MICYYYYYFTTQYIISYLFVVLFVEIRFFVERLSEVGYQVGARVLELLTYRDKNSKRETKLLCMKQKQSAVPLLSSEEKITFFFQ